MVERETALLIKSRAMIIVADLDTLLFDIRDQCSADDFQTIKRGVGLTIGRSWNDPAKPSDNIERKLLRVKRLINQDAYEEALAECDRLLSSDPEQTDEILRVRSHAFVSSGDYKSAVRDYERVINGNSPELRDYNLGAFWAISAGELEKAVAWFEKLLQLGKEQTEMGLESSTLFYLSYAHMKLDNYHKAIQYLDEAIRIEADLAMPIPEGMCSYSQLREEIERRKKMRKSHRFD